MESAPLPENESQRLESLRLYRILDTPPEVAFDRITRIIAKTVGVPIALVSLVDQDRQWFKSKYGIEASETPRELAFCSHAILGNEVFVVEDALLDSRFADNPLVVADPSVRFYAGAPLRTSEGHNLGTLCAIDQSPRKLSGDHQQLLEDMAHLVVDELELRLGLQQTMSRLAEETRLRKMHDEFIATVSHELRTPLTSIKGSLKMLEHGVAGELPAPAIELLAIANRNSDNLLNLINDLLDFQKMESGEMTFDFTTVATEKLLDTTCENLRGYAVKNNISLDVVCNGAPSIMGDFARLGQALANLISNAIKFSPANGTVTISLQEADDAVCFEVTDCGPGIPEQFQPRLFNRFSQAADLGDTKGTGLGLAITKEIVDTHNGTIGFDTSPDKGTTFRMTIPKQQTFTHS